MASSHHFPGKSSPLFVFLTLIDTRQCTVKLVEDPGVPIVHVLLLEDDNDVMDENDHKVNVYDQQVKMTCVEKNARE